MKTLLPALLAAGLPLAAFAADAPAPSGPPVSITLGARHGHVTPLRKGCTHTGGGNIDVAQPTPDTIIVTMTGVAVAGALPCRCSSATLQFDLDQCFQIAFDDPNVRSAKLTMEARVIGLLRTHHCSGGTAEAGPACATVICGDAEVLTVCAPPHCAAKGENLSVNCKEGPCEVGVAAGPYSLHQTFTITARHPICVLPCKAASAEFAPDPALDPLWISYGEPFHGAAKKDFGFQVLLKVAPANDVIPVPAPQPAAKKDHGGGDSQQAAGLITRP